MKLFYLDDSGSSGLNLDDKEQPLFVLGGVVVDSDKWLSVDEKLHALKLDFGISNTEIHALEIANSKGVFKEWSFDKKQDFLKKCLSIVRDFKLDIIFFKVIKANYKSYFESNFSKAHQQMVKIPPYIIAYSYILQIAEQLLSKTNQNGIIIADEQDTHITANDTLKILRAIDEPEIKINKLIEKSFFTSSKDSNLLQLADILAYYIKRFYEIEIKHGLTQKSISERETMFDIFKDRIYEPDFDYTKHKILKFIKDRLDE